MSLYSRLVFPRLCDFLLDQPLVAQQRRELLAHASGGILEIGIGTGLNLPCYPKHVQKITAIDPNPGMHRRAQRRSEEAGVDVDNQVISGEQLPFEDAKFDCVVSTFTLCSIEDVATALSEVIRVLKPGGQLLTLEHGLSSEPTVQKWQRRLNGLEQLLADNCHLDRNIG